MKILFIALLFELIGCRIHAVAQDLVYKETADLNGDGQAEKIVLTGTDDSYDFSLNISGKEIKESFNDGAPDELEVIDIDENDKYKEVLVHSPGASDDHEYFIYWYDGSEIHRMDHPFDYAQPAFPGNGFVYVGSWAEYYIRTEKYQFDPSSGSFTEIPQYAYFVGIKVQVLKPFVIYSDEALIQKVALLGKDSEIEIILDRYNNSGCGFQGHLFLIKSQTGLIGWAKVDGINEYIILPSAD